MKPEQPHYQTLLEAITHMLPACDQSHANVVLAATLRQLSAGIDYQSLIVDEPTTSEAADPAVDRFASLDLDIDA